MQRPTCFVVRALARSWAALALPGLIQAPVLADVETIAVQQIAAGLTAPNYLTHAGDGSGRLFILDQAGQIRIVDAGGNLSAAPFLDIAARMVALGAFGPGSFDERGLLGLAFHPDFANNLKFYVCYSAPQPPPVPITFESGNPIPSDVTFSGGIIGTQFTPPLYCSGARAFEVSANQMATVTFAEPVIKVRFFFVRRVGSGPGSVTAVLGDNSTLGPVAANAATVACDPNNFVTFEDFNFPVVGIKRLELQAGTGAGLVLFLDDLEITRFNHKSRISEFSVPLATPDAADPGSERILLEIDQPQFNHNAGTLAFGPDDGLLYVSVGDGGNGNDVGPFHNAAIGNGQDKTRLLGKMLRIDVSGDDFPGDPLRNYAIPPANPFAATPGCADGCDEIFAYGLRNPFRFTFDMGGTHQLFCGDAGQDLFEEVSIIELGQNMGWRIREGLHCFDPNNPFTPPVTCPSTGADGEPLIDPIIEYSHFEDFINMTGPVGQVVIGGNIYRGTAFPGLAGKLVFGDFSRPPFGGPADGSIFIGSEISPDDWQRTEPFVSNGVSGRLSRFVHGFGQDADGEVYICTTVTGTPFGASGEVFRIVPSSGDINGDGAVSIADIDDFVAVLTGASSDPAAIDRADLDGDGAADGNDIQPFIDVLL